MKLKVKTKGHYDFVNITEDVQKQISAAGIEDGICLVFVAGSTAAITTVEYESGVLEDIKDVLVYNPEILIVGTGANGLMRILDETKRYLESKGIELRIADTEKACKIYNELQGKRKVIGAFHLTC